jgi:hypothetical protein
MAEFPSKALSDKRCVRKGHELTSSLSTMAIADLFVSFPDCHYFAEFFLFQIGHPEVQDGEEIARFGPQPIL